MSVELEALVLYLCAVPKSNTLQHRDEFSRNDENLVTCSSKLCWNGFRAPMKAQGQEKNGNDSLGSLPAAASCSGLDNLTGHQEILDPNFAAGRVAQPLGELHRDAALAAQDQRQVRFGAVSGSGQFRLADLGMAIHPDGERVFCIHDRDFASGKVYLSSITLLGGNGHAQLSG